MINNRVLKPVRPDSIPAKSRKNFIPAHMFLKMKYKADGSFDKVKARLVANGDRQPFDTIGETFRLQSTKLASTLNLTTPQYRKLTFHPMTSKARSCSQKWKKINSCISPLDWKSQDCGWRHTLNLRNIWTQTIS
jgi:hypothetical protein